MAHQQRSPFDIVEHEFMKISSGDGGLCLDGNAVGHGLPKRPIPLDELRCILLHPSISFDARDAALTELVRRAQSQGGPWTTGVIGVVLPGVRSRVGHIARACPPRAHDIEAEALVGLLDGIARCDKGRERVASTLVWSAVRAAHGFVKSECAQQSEITIDAAPVEPHWPWNHPDLVLARAVEAEVISMEEARMIGATYVEGMTLKSYSQHIDVNYETCKKRQQRAVERLVGWLVQATVSPKQA